MKTLKKVTITPIFVEQFLPPAEELVEESIYISMKYKCSVHKCLCGCGNLTILPFDNKFHGWELIIAGDKISFTPSVGNFNFPCKSHYIITNNVANFV